MPHPWFASHGVSNVKSSPAYSELGQCRTSVKVHSTTPQVAQVHCLPGVQSAQVALQGSRSNAYGECHKHQLNVQSNQGQHSISVPVSSPRKRVCVHVQLWGEKTRMGSGGGGGGGGGRSSWRGARGGGRSSWRGARSFVKWGDTWEGRGGLVCLKGGREKFWRSYVLEAGEGLRKRVGGWGGKDPLCIP